MRRPMASNCSNGFSEIEIGDLRSGPCERACGLFEESFRVLFRAVPEHGAAKPTLSWLIGMLARVSVQNL